MYDKEFVARVKRDAIRLCQAGVLENWSDVARKFGVNRQSLHKWGAKDPDWYRAMKSIFEGETQNPPPPVPDLETFRRDYFGHDTPRHMAEWAEFIDEHDISLILVPPEHAKTTWAIEYLTHEIVRDRNVRTMYVCSNQVEARKRLSAVQERLADHDFYEANGFRNLVQDYGPFAPVRNDRTGKAWTADYFRVTGATAGEKDYTMQALGLRGKIYGTRLDRIILDDIVEDWVNENEQERIISWLLGRVQTRLSRNGKLIILATRVHEQDIYGSFLEAEWAGSWAKMVQPAILDEEKELTLWPEYWSYHDLVTKRRDKMRPRDWSLIFQQEAVGLPGSPFPLEVLENSKSERAVGHVPPGLPVVMGVDPATDGTCAIVVLAIDRSSRMRYIVDVIAKSELGQREAIKAEIFYAARRYKAIRCRVEHNFAQLGDDPDLKAKLHNLGCNLEKWVTSPKEKYDPEWGVLGTAGRFAEGLFDIPSAPGSERTMRPFIEELALWRAGRKGKQDRVMALWFADLSAERLGVFRPGMPRRRDVPPWVSQMKVPGWVGEFAPN